MPGNSLRVAAELAPGVNLVGFLEGELGLGEVARRLARALEHSGVPFSAISYPGIDHRHEYPLRLRVTREATYDTNLICLNADYLPQFTADVGADFFARRYSIGVWFWETTVLRNEDRAASRYLDEVWVASEYVRSAVAPGLDVPVHVFPVPIEAPEGAMRSRVELGLPEGFMFLFLFDFVSAQRKNPRAVVEAYTRAFAPGDGAFLVLKSMSGRERKPRELERLRTAAAGRPDILVLDGCVSTDERDSFLAACDCYVSLHRSEGFGLTMSEAMALGKPVVATAYSGNLEFMNAGNSHLVPYHLVPVPPDWWAYESGAEWAEPDIEFAVRLMRDVYEQREEARGGRGRNEILERFGLERTSTFVSNRLDEVRSRGAIGARRSPHDARPATLEAAQRVAKGGDGLVEQAGSRPASLIRRLFHRALWPYLEDRRRFDQSLLDSLVALHRYQGDLGRRIAALETRSREQLRPGGDDESAREIRARVEP